VSLDLAHKLGAMPSLVEIAEAMDIPFDEHRPRQLVSRHHRQNSTPHPS
jgi:hypothetical protein